MEKKDSVIPRVAMESGMDESLALHTTTGDDQRQLGSQKFTLKENQKRHQMKNGNITGGN